MLMGHESGGVGNNRVGGLPEALPFAYRMRKPDAMSRPPLLAKGSHRVGVCSARKPCNGWKAAIRRSLDAGAKCGFRPASSIAPPEHLGRSQTEPPDWPGAARSEERPSFDGLCPAMTARAPNLQ